MSRPDIICQRLTEKQSVTYPSMVCLVCRTGGGSRCRGRRSGHGSGVAACSVAAAEEGDRHAHDLRPRTVQLFRLLAHGPSR
eukprot:scaffold207_cov409-Prasinococcus_capsulatus_cf.AAC.130